MLERATTFRELSIRFKKKQVDTSSKATILKKKKTVNAEIREQRKIDNAIEFSKKACKLLFRKKIEIIGENYIDQLTGKGPVLILGTHTERIEAALIQAITDGHVQWLSGFNYSSQFKVLLKIPALKKLADRLGNVEVNRLNLTPSGAVKIVKRGINILENGGTLGVFPSGYSGRVDPLKDKSNIGHSGAILIAREAEKALKTKIPVILVSIAKGKNGKYYMIQKKTNLPDGKFDKDELIKEYMYELEYTRFDIERNI